MIEERLNLEIWDRLFRGESFAGLPLQKRDGRIDLRGVFLPPELLLSQNNHKGINYSKIEPGAIFHHAKWKDLDFTGSKLRGLRFFDSEISNCCFDACELQDLRIWATNISNSSFEDANLQKSSLGGVINEQRNVFERVNFIKTDLRKTGYKAMSFSNCVFREAKLENIDFQTSAFSGCVFEGELRRVLFYNRGFGGESFPANEMINVDFAKAKLHFVEFRGLLLDKVVFPNDAEHIIILNFVPCLDNVIAILQRESDVPSRKLVAYFSVIRKWATPRQTQGVVNIQDLISLAGEEGAFRVKKLFYEIAKSEPHKPTGMGKPKDVGS